MQSPSDNFDPPTLPVPDRHGDASSAHQPTANGGGPARPPNRRNPQGSRAPRLVRITLLVLLGGVLGALLGAAVGAALPERYEVSSYLAVTADEDADAGTTPTDYAQVFSRIARQPAVLLDASPDAELGTFGQGITVTAFPDAPIIAVTGSADSPELATLRANTVAEALRDYSTGDAAVGGYEVEILTEALVEGADGSTDRLVSIAAGIMLGLFVGFVVAMGISRRARP
jgi:capsular polysaccharide biosynthesis protein